MDITGLVRTSLGDPTAEIAEQRVEPLPHPPTLSTTGLSRVRGVTTTGRPWSFVVKSIHSVRHWPGLDTVPEHMRADFVAQYPWRTDVDAYLADEPLPEGLRMPRLYQVDDLGEDRLVVWMEDVEACAKPWDLDRYRTAARLLGELAASRPATASTNLGLHALHQGPIQNLFLPALADPATWRHPLLPGPDDPLRADLLAIAEVLPEIIRMVDGLPYTRCHGDACPANLLVPVDGSAEFVAIDWSWGAPAALGFDLGQLLVGQSNDGVTEPEELPAVHDTIVAAYADMVGADPIPGYVGSLLVRGLWMAIPLERMGEEPTPELAELFRKRIGLARFVTGLFAEHVRPVI
ncbi:hypothetical protein Aph01nite_67330 [Acrocarpospora phusangensis]|uniref:Aminoglycoside phosphotransferase domain-containing protein n=2 Tax=Acrocarpospora phusangensis TaxID=1070424 RepID=A0A919QIT4_9ACTN|nr:hypothetical protein Aph01nite_67330 [Acrocarpospora phusangensis]